MTVFEIGVIFLALGIAICFVLLLMLIGFVYKKLRDKYESLEEREKGLQESINRVNEARVTEGKDLRKSMESIEHKLDVLLTPEGAEKELAKEKIKAHARK